MNYKTKTFQASGNTYSIIIASGTSNYISIRKETNNPYKMSGKQFNTFDEVQQAYKDPQIKLELLKIELDL
jgi:hypothetical protein